MLKKILLGLPLLAMLAGVGPVAAQTSAAKNELVVKILQLQRPAIEGLATMLANQPAQQMMQGANMALQTRIAPDKRQDIAKEIEADLKKYANEVVPIARERAVKLAPGTIGVLLEEKFTEEELRELIKIMESPVNKKFGLMNAELQKSLAEKLVVDARPVIDPKVKALETTIAKRLGLETKAAAPAPAPAPAPASTPPSVKPASK